MLFHSSIRKDLARSFWTSWVVLFTIVMTLMLIRTLGLASEGELDPESLTLALAYSALGRMPLILSVALFIAVVSTMSRMYRDSEMVIWFNSGAGIFQFIAPAFRFAWPILIAILALQIWAWSWHNAQLDTLKGQFEARGNIDRVAPGEFKESASGDLVFFMDKTSDTGQKGNDIFISSKNARGTSVISAKDGQVVDKPEGQFMELTNGQQVRLSADGQQQTVTIFERQGNLVKEPIAIGTDYSLKSATTRTLLKRWDTPAQGELAWRLGMAFMAFNFVLLGLAVAKQNTRGTGGSPLLMAMLTAIIYFNLHTVSSSWISFQKVDFIPMMLALHGGAFSLALLWLYKRHRQIALLDVLKALISPRPAEKTTA